MTPIPDGTIHVPLSVIANGYSDQSHFIRNFRKFSGIPPSDYIDELKNEERGSGILFWNLTRDASNYKMHELA
jgi:AraC-like DNA-binding protein